MNFSPKRPYSDFTFLHIFAILHQCMRNTFFGIPLLHKPTMKFRVEIFKEYAAKRKESVWTQLLTLLNRPVGFIMNMTARVIAKMACWSRDLMQGADLQVHTT